MRNLVHDIDLDEDYETFQRFGTRPNWKGPKARNTNRDNIRRKRQAREQQRQELTENFEDDNHGQNFD